MRRTLIIPLVILLGILVYSFSGHSVATDQAAAAKRLAAPPTVKEAACFECHTEIQALKTGGRHASVNCANCHTGTTAHLADAEIKPSTRTDLEACAGCHNPDAARLSLTTSVEEAKKGITLVTDALQAKTATPPPDKH